MKPLLVSLSFVFFNFVFNQGCSSLSDHLVEKNSRVAGYELILHHKHLFFEKALEIAESRGYSVKKFNTVYFISNEISDADSIEFYQILANSVLPQTKLSKEDLTFYDLIFPDMEDDLNSLSRDLNREYVDLAVSIYRGNDFQFDFFDAQGQGICVSLDYEEVYQYFMMHDLFTEKERSEKFRSLFRVSFG